MAGLADDALGQQGVTQLELMKMVAEGKVQITPQVMVTGGGGIQDALAGTILNNAGANQSPHQPQPTPTPGKK